MVLLVQLRQLVQHKGFPYRNQRLRLRMGEVSDMVLYTDIQKKQRKITIKAKETLANLDRFSTPTQSRVIEHPRAHNKPYSCELGRHDLFTDSMMGIPFLTCRKCGWTTLKSAHEGTETKRELRTRNIPKTQPRTYLTSDIIDLFYPERRRRW